MTWFHNLLGMLAFRTQALRAQAERRALAGSILSFAVGFWAYTLVRNSVYAPLLRPPSRASFPIGVFLNFDLITAVLFLTLVYVPAIVILSNAILGDGIGLSISRREYHTHVSVLLPLWGMLLLIAAPIQWLIPDFLVYQEKGISVGMLAFLILFLSYTLWAIRKLNYLSAAQSIGVFILSLFCLPLYFLLVFFQIALPLFFMIPLIYFGYQWMRAYIAAQVRERAYQQNLHALTINPQDADAHYQIGLIHLARRNLDAARKCFEKAIEIDSGDPDYHYSLGRAFELKEAWAPALEQYEETYRLNPEYRLGDIFREVGKGYLNTGSIDKGIEFLNFFLAKRSSDPEGRYWLAMALKQSGDIEQMRFQLHTILQQARTNPGFFRKENREWVYRARMMIRNSS